MTAHAGPLQPAEFRSDTGGIHVVAGTELRDRRREVIADGAIGQVQFNGDLRRVQADGVLAQDFGLPGNQRAAR